MREVGNHLLNRVYLLADPIEFNLDFVHPFPQPPSFLLAGFTLRLILGLTDRLGNRVGLLVDLLDLGLLQLALVFQLDKAFHISVNAAIFAVFLNEIRVLNNKFSIEHGYWILCLIVCRIVFELKFKGIQPFGPSYPPRNDVNQ